MHFRSHNTRWNCARVARLAWAALSALSIAGCQSNSDRDLIARERRIQEDQMWAMQDYIQQYQQLVCQFRSENASLRRQLSDERNGPANERELQPVPSTPTKPPATNGAPKFQNSPTPGMEKNQLPSPNIEIPDIPPLKPKTSTDARASNQTLAEHQTGPAEPDRYAQLASYDSRIDGAAATAGKPAADDASRNSSRNDSATTDVATTVAAPDILLSGEVVANDAGGGPRLVIDIESFDQSGRIARFDGDVSLALITSEGGVQRRLARWDFGPDDIRSAVDPAASEPTMRFRVELPAGTKTDGPTELWAKLAPTNGARLFSHAKLSLAKPGVFSSRTDKLWASEESVVAASYDDTFTQPLEVASTINEGTWATARPGKPAILPPESVEATGGWKAASEPLPGIVKNTMPSANDRNDRPEGIEPASTKAARVDVARKPSWLPERPGSQPQVARPSWSATR